VVDGIREFHVLKLTVDCRWRTRRAPVDHRGVETAGVDERRLCTLWSRDGRKLYFATPRREMVKVSVRSDPRLQLGERTVLFEIPNDMCGGVQEYYTANDVARDGRFLMLRRSHPTAGA
jgi:hypothetical protein